MTSSKIKPVLHFLDKDLITPGNPLLVNVIGIGGTGSHVLTYLADINAILVRTGHPGILVRAFDADVIAPHNPGRQRFASSEIGGPKAAAKINRINRFYGTDWKAMLYPFCLKYQQELLRQTLPFLTITCVDTVVARFEIEKILLQMVRERSYRYQRDQMVYWMDFGNSRYTGQVQLGTFITVEQPTSNRYTAVGSLPLFTEEYRAELSAIDDTLAPSCSLEESLEKQDLFINPTLAVYGTRLIYQLLKQNMIAYRGLFINIDDVKTAPIPIEAPQMDLKMAA